MAPIDAFGDVEPDTMGARELVRVLGNAPFQLFVLGTAP